MDVLVTDYKDLGGDYSDEMLLNNAHTPTHYVHRHSMSRDGEPVMEPDLDASNASQNLGDADPTQGTHQQRENEPLLTPEERTDMIRIIATTDDLEERREILAVLEEDYVRTEAAAAAQMSPGQLYLLRRRRRQEYSGNDTTAAAPPVLRESTSTTSVAGTGTTPTKASPTKVNISHEQLTAALESTLSKGRAEREALMGKRRESTDDDGSNTPRKMPSMPTPTKPADPPESILLPLGGDGLPSPPRVRLELGKRQTRPIRPRLEQTTS